jgi:Flp pilus assembly protein TadG
MIGRLARLLARLRRQSKGAVLVEMALMAPVFMTMLMGSLEIGNYVVTYQKVARIAGTYADMLAEGGDQLTEAQVRDMLSSANTIAHPINLATSGRVIITALNGTTTGNRALWRRCTGTLAVTTAYPGTGALTLPGAVVLPVGSTAIIAEATLRFTPWFTGWFLPQQNIGVTAMFRSRAGNFRSTLPNPDGVAVGTSTC